MDKFATIGVMGAMQEEISSLKQAMQDPVTIWLGGREYICGKLFGKSAVVVFSRWGKVAAAATAATLIAKFNVDCLLFTGVAGAVNADLNVGDIVLGNRLYQHDMDASPLFSKREIPCLGIDGFDAHPNLLEKGQMAVAKFLASSYFSPNNPVLQEFAITAPKLYPGIIASGDQFINHVDKIKALHQEVSGTLAVEMEGAAVAQVCYEHDVPNLVIRTISDRADHQAPVDFTKFVAKVASYYAIGILEPLLISL